MTDRGASSESVSRSRHRSPEKSEHLEANPASVTQTATFFPRRRSARPTTVLDDIPQSTPSAWIDTDKADCGKAKGSRITLRKASKTSPQSLASSEEKDTGGFLPRLGRILEGKENKASRHRQGATDSSVGDPTPARRRRRSAEDAGLNRRAIRQKHGSLQRGVERLTNLPNPSLISVLSELTQHSSESSGSNATITQKSYDRHHIAKRKPTKERRRLQTQRGLPTSTSDTMEPRGSNVFRYMNESLTSDQFLNGHREESRPSTASSSSTDSSRDIDDDGSSSTAGEPVVESPLTSPASIRRPDNADAHDDDSDSDSDSDSDISVREASPGPVHQPSVSDEAEGNDQYEVEVEEDGANDEDSEEEGGAENASATDEYENQQHHARNMALERTSPPRLPSASSSRHSDRHTRRLRRQEQALNEHVLQSPQPHRDFQFVGGPPPHSSYPTMPLYDPYSQSDTSPVSFYTQAHHAPPPAPPPPMGYYSPPHAAPVPYSPATENHLAMAPRPPMAVSSAMVQPPPFPYSPTPAPHYPAQPTGPVLAKTTMVGYELLADKLSEGSKGNSQIPGEQTVVPMYRKFENLNHRVLLHLQDEISELEEELRHLDECITQCSPRNEAGYLQPASRRGEARYGNELHFRRTELLGRIYLKLGQYNSALSSFSSMLKDLEPANTKDIQAYRAWVEKRAPIDYAETRYLERSTDLVTVPRKPASTAGGGSPHQSAAIFLPLILVLPLMAFALVPSLLGRLFVLILIGGGILRLLSTTKELMDLMSTREWTGCFSIYFGLMAVLAAVVH